MTRDIRLAGGSLFDDEKTRAPENLRRSDVVMARPARSDDEVRVGIGEGSW